MPEVKSVTITYESGFGPVSEAYQEKLVITGNSLSYQFIPHMENKNDEEKAWSYKSSSEFFLKSIRESVNEMVKLIWMEERSDCLDARPITFNILFTDKSKFKRVYLEPVSEFRKILSPLKKLVPQHETMPEIFKEH